MIFKTKTGFKIPHLKLLNAALRITPVFLKFVVIILFAEVLSLEDYGFFNLVVTSVTIGIYVLGLDFYYFSNREIIIEKTKRHQYVFSSIVVYLIIYVIFYFFLVLLTPSGLADRGLVNNVAFLIISEHLNQECYRTMICLKKVLHANIIFFFRTSSWTLLVIYIVLFGEFQDTPILDVLNYWIIANIFAILAVLIYIVFCKNRVNFTLFFLDRDFIARGLKLTRWVFLGTILLKATEYSSRYITEIFLGNTDTAIFTYYATIAIAMNLYINTVVTSFEYPALVETVSTPLFYKQLSLFNLKIRQHVLFSGILILLLGYFVTKELSKPAYLNNYWILPIMAIGVSFMNLSLGNHFNLYANKKDKSIMWINIISGVITILTTSILIKSYGLLGGSFSVLTAGLILLFLRKRQVKKHGL